MNTTANTMFYSKSNAIGSTRWAFELPPDVPRGYVLDMGFMAHLPSRWYAVALQQVGSGWQFRVNALGADAEVSLEAADLQTATLGAEPVMLVALDVSDAAVAVERFERVTANLMHGLLEPTPAVLKFWERFATTDGSNVYTP